jgi:uncharacterized damage-inducible protein DinB
MKRALGIAALLMATVLTMPIHAQEKKAPKPPVGEAQAVLDQWNDIGRKLIAMAEDFPEDKYDFKPTPAQKTFAERLIHVAAVNYFFTNPATGQAAPGMEDPKRDQFKTKADVAAYVKKSFADGAAAIKARGDKGMSDLVVDSFENQQVRVSDLAYGLAEHAGEIYGQLVVYYRVAGMVPPESRPKK